MDHVKVRMVGCHDLKISSKGWRSFKKRTVIKLLSYTKKEMWQIPAYFLMFL